MIDDALLQCVDPYLKLQSVGPAPFRLSLRLKQRQRGRLRREQRREGQAKNRFGGSSWMFKYVWHHENRY